MHAYYEDLTIDQATDVATEIYSWILTDLWKI